MQPQREIILHFARVMIIGQTITNFNTAMVEKDLLDYLAAASKLYKEVVAPVSKLLSGDQLIIVPDGPLWHLNFDVLLTVPTDSKNPRELPYLLNQYAISYAYSNRLLFDPVAQERIRRAQTQFAGFGLEYDEYTLSGDDQIKADTTFKERSVGRLVYSDDEVKALRQLVGGRQWLNDEATKAAFLQHAPHTGILHLAMHSVVDEESPMNTALIFTRTRDTIDYLLRAYEIYSMDLSAQMTVLSACHTAHGRLVRGEGIRSLARAFAYAGCPSLIATLWSASDQSTKEILVQYYQALSEGLPKDIALQKAKLTYISSAPPSFNGPYYWSHLVHIGETGAVETKKANSKNWLIAGMIVLGLLGIGGLRGRSSQRS